MECNICKSENVKYKNSKKEFAIGKVLCRKCYNVLFKKTKDYKEYKSNYDLNRYERDKEAIINKSNNYYRNNKEKCSLVKKIYYNNNRYKFLASSRGYKVKKLNATPKWLSSKHKEEINLIYKKSQELSLTTGISYEVDHIIPIKSKFVCGLHVPWNLQILTSYENRSKSNKLVEDIV